MVPDTDPAAGPAHARTDRQSAGRSVVITPETLYLTTIALQRARIDALEARVDRRERELQHVIDRYEAVLDGPAPGGEPVTDGGEALVSAHGDASDDLRERVIARLQRLL